MSRTSRIAVFVNYTFIVGVLAALIFAAPSHAFQRVTCQEDAPCFNWATMGNHQRGVVLKSGRQMVVGPCRFVHLRSAHRIDFSELGSRMRGDRSAHC